MRDRPGARLLVLTNMWPDSDRPVYGIFVKRQVDSIEAELGLAADVWYVPGYVSKVAYFAAAFEMARNRRSIAKKYDLLHVHAGETSLASWFVDLPKVISYCGDDLLGRRDSSGEVRHLHRLQRRLNRTFAASFDSIIVKSEEMKESLPARLTARASVVPNGVDTSLFRPINKDEAQIKLGWSTGSFRALFVATHPRDPRKRLSLAEEACAVSAELVGEPVELVVADNFEPSDMPLLMNGADLLLHTSLLEGSPNAVKEALACNLPVVATDSGDIRKLLSGVEPGTVSEADAGALGVATAVVLSSGLRSNGVSTMSYLGQDVVAQDIGQIYTRTAGALADLHAMGSVTL